VVDWWSHLRKVPRRRRISHTYPACFWGCSSGKISSPGPIFHGTKWLLWRPHIQSPTLHSRCGINKGFIKRGSTISLKVTVQGLDFMAHPFLIHTYMTGCDISNVECLSLITRVILLSCVWPHHYYQFSSYFQAESGQESLIINLSLL
jgi:hypothetical protein